MQRAEFVVTDPPFASCHAATLVESGGAICCAFFGGSREGKPDVCIWFCRRDGDSWSEPIVVGDGAQADGQRFATWNPVLFQPSGGPLMLFYKVGPSPSKWWGVVRTSDDAGRTWSDPRRLPAGILGPAKNKPVQLGSAILSPCSDEHPENGWRIYFERSDDGGATWQATPPVEQPPEIPKATQPTILVHSAHKLQAICRTTIGRLCETWSNDGGRTWQPLRLIDLPNCNSGVDAVTLRDGRHLLVYNHSNLEKVRYPLNVAITRDGATWQAAAVLESEPPGQYSYPAVMQSLDGLVHIAYTFKRRNIKYVVMDPSAIEPQPIEMFVCPPPGSPTHRSDEFQ
ncbi:MAG TPA: sialidase family protein [Tepidisphaeraceae bacterium]|nr:sialidase family protein [Tepidisphaeraceae bacterium]